MTTYAVIYEQGADGSWSVRAADLPVYSVGASRDEAEASIREAIALHLDVLSQTGEPTSPAAVVDAGVVVV